MVKIPAAAAEVYKPYYWPQDLAEDEDGQFERIALRVRSSSAPRR